jgi:tape measure domain-containing protein
MADTLQPVGVRLVAENEAGFRRAIDGANQSIAGLARSASGSGGGTASMLGMGAAMGVVSAVAMAGINAIMGLTSKIAGMATAAFQNATELQNLTISLESLAAREQLATGTAKDMNEALSQAGPIAQDLLEKIRDLSVASPFEYKDVVSVFRLNMAFGQTADTSLKLTKAITDIAAASGQGGYIMQRLAYNFSQMSMTGQVTMRDIRDLAMAGFDLAKVFRDELSMSVEEVNNALKAGELTMQDVSNAFVEYADKNFGGAAERMSRTITGVMSSLRDLAFFASTDILGGALNNIGTALANVFDRARAITDSGVLQVVGVVFEVLTSRAAEASERLPKITESTLTSMGDKFMAFTEQAFDYGLNIMVQFAYGIIDGANFVVDAVLWVVNAIAGLLMPGSPPKALPDIDKWGTKTFLEYLRGFTEADFGVLKDIQRPIREALSLLDITGPKAAAMYGGFSQAIAKMLTTGTLDQGVFNTMAKSLGKYGAEIAKLAKQETELALAMRAVDNARKAEQNAWTDLQKKVYAYNRAVKEGADAGTLAGLRAQVETAEATFETASAEREATEEKYQNIDAMKEQVDIQKQIVDQLLDIARMQKMAALKGAGGAGGGFTLPEPPSGGTRAVTSAWEEKIKQFRDDLKKKLDLAMIDLGKHFQESSVGKLFDAIKQALFGDKFTQGVGGQPWLMLPGMENIINIPESRVTGIQKLLELITGKTVDLSKAIEVADRIQAFIDKVKEIWTDILPAVNIIGKLIGALIAIGFAVEAFQLAFAGLILFLAGSALGEVIGFITANFGKVKEAVGEVAGVVGGWLTQAWQGFINFVNSFVMPVLNNIWSFIQTYIIPIIQLVIDIVGLLVNLALTALHGFLDKNIIPVFEAFWDILANKVWPAIENLWKIITDSLTPVWEYLYSSIVKPFKELIDKLSISLGTKLKDALQWVIDKLKEFKDWLGKITLPDWLTPGSPTPFETGLYGINNALDKANTSVRQLSRNLNSLDGKTAVVSMLSGSVPSQAYAGSSNTTYNVPITVNANVSGNTDVHQLAYVIAREFNQRMNR